MTGASLGFLGFHRHGSPMDEKKVGYWFQDKVRASLVDLQRKLGVFFYFMKDSRTAGKLTSNTPADFLVAYMSRAQLWECKASVEHMSLRSCLSSMVSPGQVGYHRLWRISGHDSLFLFYSDQTALVEVWPGDAVVAARLAGRPLEHETMIKVFELKKMADYLPPLFMKEHR